MERATGGSVRLQIESAITERPELTRESIAQHAFARSLKVLLISLACVWICGGLGELVYAIVKHRNRDSSMPIVIGCVIGFAVARFLVLPRGHPVDIRRFRRFFASSFIAAVGWNVVSVGAGFALGALGAPPALVGALGFAGAVAGAGVGLWMVHRRSESDVDEVLTIFDELQRNPRAGYVDKGDEGRALTKPLLMAFAIALPFGALSPLAGVFVLGWTLLIMWSVRFRKQGPLIALRWKALGIGTFAGAGAPALVLTTLVASAKWPPFALNLPIFVVALGSGFLAGRAWLGRAEPAIRRLASVDVAPDNKILGLDATVVMIALLAVLCVGFLAIPAAVFLAVRPYRTPQVTTTPPSSFSFESAVDDAALYFRGEATLRFSKEVAPPPMTTRVDARAYRQPLELPIVDGKIVLQIGERVIRDVSMIEALKRRRGAYELISTFAFDDPTQGHVDVAIRGAIGGDLEAHFAVVQTRGLLRGRDKGASAFLVTDHSTRLIPDRARVEDVAYLVDQNGRAITITDAITGEILRKIEPSDDPLRPGPRVSLFELQEKARRTGSVK